MRHKTKHIISLALALAMLLGINGTALAAGESDSPKSFTDVAETNWYYEYVSAMAESGVINGYQDGTFRPDGIVTWGEALKMVLLYAAYDEQEPIVGGSWASGYISLAVNEGILDAAVEQNTAITRLEMCRMLAKALKIEAAQKESPFPDVSDNYVTALVDLGVIDGVDGKFQPNSELTRAQLCKIIYAAPPAPSVKSPYPWAEDLKESDIVTDIDGDALLASYDDVMALFDEYTFKAINPDVGDVTYYVYDPTAHGFPVDGSYPVVMWLHGRDNAFLGRRVIAAGGAAGMATTEAQAELGGMYIICPLANEDKESAGWWVQHSEGAKSDNPKDLIEGDGIYNTSLKGILDEVKANNPSINDTLFMAGTSAGGMCIGSFMKKYHDSIHVDGIFWMSTIIPTAEAVKQYSDEGTHMWFEISKHDELGFYYSNFPEGDTSAYQNIENFELTDFDWIRCADKSIASCYLGVYQGQHCSCFQVNHNLMFDDNTPYDESHPRGVTGWFHSVIDSNT